jgi:hypothetical protein
VPSLTLDKTQLVDVHPSSKPNKAYLVFEIPTSVTAPEIPSDRDLVGVAVRHKAWREQVLKEFESRPGAYLSLDVYGYALTGERYNKLSFNGPPQPFNGWEISVHLPNGEPLQVILPERHKGVFQAALNPPQIEKSRLERLLDLKDPLTTL